MFQARGRETEHTLQWEFGVGHPRTSARSSREHAEAEISFPSLSRAREAVPAARFWVLEGSTLFRPRARRPDSGRQPRECTTFGRPEPRTQPRVAGQPHRLEQKTTFQPSDTFHCNLVRRLVSGVCVFGTQASETASHSSQSERLFLSRIATGRPWPQAEDAQFRRGPGSGERVGHRTPAPEQTPPS